MKKVKRAIHFDFHTMPGFDKLAENFNAERFADRLSENHVEYINIAARCNIGFSYYNTKVGTKYPLLERDLLRETLDACHNRGIGVSAYINAGLNHEAFKNNYGWCRIAEDGRIYRWEKGLNFFRHGCYNSGFADRVLEEVREIKENYDVDGIFCDCIANDVCFCPECMSEMNRLGIDHTDREEVLKYQNGVRMAFCRRIKEIIGNDIRCILNGIPWDESIHSHVELECLPSGGWGYEYLPATAPYCRTRFKDLWYMSGRFQDSWGDFGGIKTVAAMENDLYDAMMHGFGISFGDQLHPLDGLEDEVITRIGKVFEEKMQYEPYDEDAVSVVETGVLVERGQFYAEPYARGLAKMLNELKIPYNIYDADGDFTALKLLIIPEKVNIDDALIDKLHKFCVNGGKILFTGSALDVAEKAGLTEDIKLLGKDERNNAYFTLEDSSMRWAAYNPCRIMKNNGGKELSKYVSAVFDRKWDGEHAYFYTPQGDITEYSAAVCGKNSAYICFDVFSAYSEKFLYEIKELVRRALNELLPQRFIDTQGLPSWSTIAVTENSLNRIVHIKATFPEHKNGRGIIEEHCFIKGGTISIDGEYKVYVLPSMQKITAEVKNGRTVFETGEILGYKAFSLR